MEAGKFNIADEIAKANFAAGIRDPQSLSKILQYIEGANMQQCKDIVDALANRVASLCGDASSLEDAAYQLEAEIEAQDLIENPPLCATCNGSGEGQYDGTRCRSCGGSGTEIGESEMEQLRRRA